MPQSPFNQTALRVLLILQWLHQGPKRLDELNHLLASHPSVGRAVSQDSVGLYVNTLRAVGCEITRPSPRNGHTYRLIKHPFKAYLEPGELEILFDALSQTQGSLEPWELIHLEQGLKALFDNLSNPNSAELFRQLMDNLRHTPLVGYQQMLTRLEAHCQNRDLLQLTYHLPREATETLTVIALQIFHHNAMIYLLAYREGYTQSSMLRLHRISHVRPLQDTARYQEIMSVQEPAHIYRIRILDSPMPAAHGWSDHEVLSIDPESVQHYQITLETNNPFLLMQQLLGSGLMFEVLEPVAFRQQVSNELQAMLGEYSLYAGRDA